MRPFTLNQALLVLTNVPDQDTAERLASMLVEQGLAGCVNILPPMTSVYRWEGKIERASEIGLLIKTTQAGYAALEVAISAQHPYDVPEIIALPVTAGLPAYLQWLDAQTRVPLRT